MSCTGLRRSPAGCSAHQSPFAKIDGEPLPNVPEKDFYATWRYDVFCAKGGRPFISGDGIVQGCQTDFYCTCELTANGNLEAGPHVGHAAPERMG